MEVLKPTEEESVYQQLMAEVHRQQLERLERLAANGGHGGGLWRVRASRPGPVVQFLRRRSPAPEPAAARCYAQPQECA